MVPYRYALNYCTINYSFSFYTWEDWEKELEWMSLNGVNIMLAPVGTELVWYNTLLKLGYTDAEAKAFVPDLLSRHGGLWEILKDGAAL